MTSIDQDYINKFNMYLNAEDNSEDEKVVEIQQGIKGNIAFNEVRDAMQILLYLVIDKSYSMYGDLEEKVRQGLENIKQVINGSYEEKHIQIAITFFGSNLDMHPFQYVENIDTSCEVDGSATRLYDAVVESCKNMISQYDSLKPIIKVSGVMLIFTDGEDNGSEQYRKAKDVQTYLNELTERDIPYIVTAFGVADLNHIGRDFNTEPRSIDDVSKLRTLMRFVSPKAVQ